MDPSDDPRRTAIEQLTELGLSTYAARTFVALASLGSGTATDVSEVADVPRTRVYDAAQELHRHGLVDVQQSTPKQFWAVSAETAARTFEQDVRHRVARFTTALNELEPAERREEQRGVWTVPGHEAVTDRVLEFFAGAEAEIVYMTVEDILTEEIVDGLGEAADRGVQIRLGGVSPEVQERIQNDVPGAEMFESLWVWSDTTAGRLLMVDGEKTLVSVLTNGPGQRAGDAGDDDRFETAIWGEGETNSLVVVLKAIFTWRLDSSGRE